MNLKMKFTMKFVRFFIFGLTSLGLNVHAQTEIKVGSKKFTESVVLGELARQSLVNKGLAAKHIAELGGTRILWNALVAGNIDVYPEYSSTIEEELLKQKFSSFKDLRTELEKNGIGITEPLGFNNTYAIGMKKDRAANLGIARISDLARHPELKLGLSEEFLQRKDGWPALKEKYNLPQDKLRGIDHDVAYRALETNDIEVIDLYSTDAEIQYYNLLVLTDDLNYFPKYEAVYLYRLATAKRESNFLEALQLFSGKVSEPLMIEMNNQAKIKKMPTEQVAAVFLKEKFAINSNEKKSSRAERIALRTQEHLKLVIVSLFFAILMGVPLGILAAKKRGAGKIILGLTGAIQTIPSLALLVVLIKPLNMLGLTGIGDTPALIALFLYSLVPIVRGAHVGFQQIPLALRETSEVIGLSRQSQL
ncbi:MAG: ABC transporter permease subunit, partial [Bdellovibrionaceae bacterium]|nr:ABC transporter permease subunit [Bdellovibrio sp.]